MSARGARSSASGPISAARGHAILLASTDAEELVDVCDRVIVMSHGRRVGELAAAS